MRIWTALKSGFQHVDEAMAVRDLAGMLWENGGKEAVTKAGARALKKWSKEAQIEAVVLARLATRHESWEPNQTESAEGLENLNTYYAALSATERQRFEKNFYSNVWSALSDGFGGEGLLTYRKITETKKKGVTTITKIPGGGPAGKYAKFLVLLGLAGRDEIQIELDRLERVSKGKIIIAPLTKLNHTLNNTLREENDELENELARRRATRRAP